MKERPNARYARGQNQNLFDTRMTQSFFVPGPLPGANDMMGKGNRWGYGKLKREWEQAIGLCIRHAKLKPVKKAVITYHWQEPNRRRDPSNITAAIKFIEDALVSSGTLHDDGWDEIAGISHSFTVDKRNPGVTVTLEEDVCSSR